jgi:carboxyl-terminal processing protease
VIDGEVAGNTALPDLTTPLYILVNENTASAAEVLSAALKENGRATLIGHRTFGKGLIQTLEPLSQGGVAITTAKYETPLHNNINKVGLPVDKEATTCNSDTLAQDCLATVI